MFYLFVIGRGYWLHYLVDVSWFSGFILFFTLIYGLGLVSSIVSFVVSERGSSRLWYTCISCL